MNIEDLVISILGNNSNLEDSKELLLKFFLKFSYIEFTLKKKNYGRKKNERYEPNWKKFIEKLDELNKKLDDELKNNISYILQYPPKGTNS